MRLPCAVHHGGGGADAGAAAGHAGLEVGVLDGAGPVLGEDHVPIEPVERFLGYLASIERSPNTVKAYAHD